MANVKIFKDATQGYIELDKKYVINLIDTYEMQRLKDVAQTGIRPVYTGASHDRFSHSLGVYNIGQKIIKAFIENVIGFLEKSGVAKSEDIKNLEMFFSDENLEKYETEEIFAVEATEHVGNGVYKKVGYDFYIGSDTQARQGSDWRFGYIAFCNY